MDRSCPRSLVEAVSTFENTLEISDRASHSRHSPERDRVESPYFPGVPVEPNPTCTIQAQWYRGWRRHARTASEFLRMSGCSAGVRLGCPEWAQPNIS